MGQKSTGYTAPTLINGSDGTTTKERIWTEEEKNRMKAAIKNAKSLAEIARLEKDFAEGRIPAYVLEGGAPMEM